VKLVGDLSPHFSRHEFGGEPHADLIRALELLRLNALGKPLVIVSGIRTTTSNAAVGGAPNSQHLLKRAADIPAGYATPRQAARAGFRGIGITGDGRWAVHVDVRRGRRAAWRYGGGGGGLGPGGGFWETVRWPGS